MMMEELIGRIARELLSQVSVESKDPYDPVVVSGIPAPWRCLGAGNYAAVFVHPEYPRFAVKVYGEGREGLEQEVEVYRRLGRHPAYSRCFHVGDHYLILERIHGITIYDCLRRGIAVPRSVIRDIDEALDYARNRGLLPHDIHAKNVMVEDGRGKVVDVSDFLKPDYCGMWDDFKKAYRRLYAPFILPRPFPLPDPLLNLMRKAYRCFRRRRGSS